MCRVTNHQTRLPRATSSLALNASRNGTSTTSLGNMFQCVTTMIVFWSTVTFYVIIAYILQRMNNQLDGNNCFHIWAISALITKDRNISFNNLSFHQKYARLGWEPINTTYFHFCLSSTWLFHIESQKYCLVWCSRKRSWRVPF